MKKRSNGEGSYQKLKSGRWIGRIMIGYNEEGKRVIKSFTASTKGEVQQIIKQYLEEQADRKEAVKNIPFSEWADTWYKDLRTEVEVSTYWSYSFTLLKLKNYFKDKPIQEIKQIDINRFLDELTEQNLSKSVISKCKSMLVQIFTYAVNNDIIKKNPAVLAKKIKMPKGCVYKKDAFTPDEIQIIREQAPDDLMGHSIKTLLGTGMRLQELLALNKNDISPDGRYVTVNKAVKMVDRQPELGKTKSERGNRVIPVRKEYRQDVLYLREHSGDKHIWTSQRENGLFTIEEFRNRYKTVMKHIPVTYRSPHCCRHTYITYLQSQKVPMDIIGALVGHSDATTTLGYTHLSTETLSGVIEALENPDKPA